MSSGLTRRRGAGGAALADGEGSNHPSRSNSTSNIKDRGENGPETSYESGENGHKIAYDPRDMNETAERSKQPKLTMMEEILLLGLKDKQVCITVHHEERGDAPSKRENEDTCDRSNGGENRALIIRRATFLFGTTTSRTPSAAASSSSSPSAARFRWKRTRPAAVHPCPTATLRSLTTA